MLLRRFMREHALLTRLDHPSVAGIYEHGFAEDFAYIAMEYFPGGMLRDRINGCGSMGEALGYVSSICAGLSAVHSFNIVHRDLKPTNILFRADGTLAIADFGISRDLTQASDLTASTGWLGTPPYMSPEQITSEALDTRSDLYSLGVMLFELLAGQRPFRHRSLPGLLSAHLYDPVPQLPAASRVCQSLVERLLAKRPEDRVSTAREAQILIEELKEYVG